MKARLAPTALPQRIQQLLEERQGHVDSVARIDETLSLIGAALSPSANSNGKSQKSAADEPVTKTKRKRRGHRGSYATTGEEALLGFIRENKNPPITALTKFWQGEGRGGRADNLLSKMVKDKKLKRTPLGDGQRGSRYSIA
jgi:hypothetical protein